MRESNFSFAVQSRASVVISSQLYDRRALDSTSPLPLSNSLTHLTYLTSTSPRIREILTLDGGLERLVRLLREFCVKPPPPRKPRAIYGLLPPPNSLSRSTGKAVASTTADPENDVSPLQSFDRQAAIRFSLAFQCVVNIGVRGSESVRSRVVQAGMLDVVSAVLECWLVSKGFAVCPSPTGSGAPRESKEVRVQRRIELLERRQRDINAVQAAELARALSGLPPHARQQDGGGTSTVQSSASRGQHRHQDPSTQPQAIASSPSHQRSEPSNQEDGQSLQRRDTLRPATTRRPPLEAQTSSSQSSSAPRPIPHRRSSNATPSTSGNVSEDTSANVTPAGGNTPTGSITVSSRERSGTVVARPMWDSDQSQPSRPSRRNSSSRPSTSASRNHDTDDDVTTEPEQEPENSRNNDPSHPTRMAVIIQPDAPEGGGMDMILDQGAEGINLQGVGIGVEQGIVNLDIQTNDDLAMGAPPGAPGAVPVARHTEHTPTSPVTVVTTNATAAHPGVATPRPNDDLTPRVTLRPLASGTPQQTQTTQPRNVTSPPVHPGARSVHTISPEQLALNVFTSTAGMSGSAIEGDQSSGPYREEDVLLSLQLLAYLSKYPHVRQAFYKPRVPFGPPLFPLRHRQSVVPPATIGPSSPGHLANPILHAPNVFSLVERFTFRPSPSEIHLPRLPTEIQYWAGVIMRNACRKDETRGGIRQCANMVCGKWESFPREFAKCRRCRKAKYCGKECQSKAWADGHRFWCSSRDADAAAANETTQGTAPPETQGAPDADPVTVARAIAATRARHRHGVPSSHPTGVAPRHGHHGQVTSTDSAHRTLPIQTLPGAQRSQPPLTHNVIVRVGGPQISRTIGIPPAGAAQFDLQQLHVTLPTVIPRQRIVQHAIAPDSMEVDRQPAAETGFTGAPASLIITSPNLITDDQPSPSHAPIQMNTSNIDEMTHEVNRAEGDRSRSGDGMVLG